MIRTAFVVLSLALLATLVSGYNDAPARHTARFLRTGVTASCTVDGKSGECKAASACAGTATDSTDCESKTGGETKKDSKCCLPARFMAAPKSCTVGTKTGECKAESDCTGTASTSTDCESKSTTEKCCIASRFSAVETSVVHQALSKVTATCESKSGTCKSESECGGTVDSDATCDSAGNSESSVSSQDVKCCIEKSRFKTLASSLVETETKCTVGDKTGKCTTADDCTGTASDNDNCGDKKCCIA